jgi:hypothetical protein
MVITSIAALVAAPAAHGQTGDPAPPGLLPEPTLSLEYDHGGQPLRQPIDNVKGSWLNFESFPVDPMIHLDIDGFGRLLMVLNQPAMTVEVFNLATHRLIYDVPVGPGSVALVARPDPSGIPTEFWLVDRVTHTVSVLGLAVPLIGNGQVLSVVATIPVGAEPHGLCFDATGARAYVTCSESRELVTIDAAIRSVLTAETVAIPAESPRAMAAMDGALWCVPLLSGNNTFPWLVPDSNLPFEFAQVVDPTEPPFAGLGLASLPDADLFRYDPSAGTFDAVATGLGTNLFHVRARPAADQLWIPLTEARNRLRGERNLESQVVHNRLAIVVPGQVPHLVDLDTLAGVPAGVRCAQPTDVAFDEARSLAFVCGYGSDMIFVLDTSSLPPTFVAHRQIPGVTTSVGRSGPRNLLLSTSGEHLYTFNKADNSFTEIDLTSGQILTTPLSYDPTPTSVKRGRMHFISADESRTRTTSCNSCHIDGHTDGEEWDLSGYLDPPGTPADQLQFERDKKGVMVTQTLRGLRDKGPYHWRGENSILEDFNQGGFVNLMQRTVNGALTPVGDAEYADAKEYMFSLVHPSNPRQPADRRVPAGPILDGLANFLSFPGTTSGHSCNDCHTLPIGTNNEIQRQAGFGTPSVGGQLAGSAVVMQLRGVNTKLTATIDVDGDGIADMTRIGSGIRHRADFPTLQSFLELGFNNLSFDQEVNIASFVELFDTGLAPSTTHQATTEIGDLGFLTGDGQYLIDEANAGHCDVIFHGPSIFLAAQTKMVTLSGVFDRSTQKFQLAAAAWPQASMADLLSTYPRKLTFLGVPLGMGRRAAIDRDLDGLLDLDEYPLGTDPKDPDHDADGYPDGHEVDHGSDPLTGASTPIDPVAPEVYTYPSGEKFFRIYQSTNTVKFDFATSEPCSVRVTSPGLESFHLTSPTEGFDVNHSVVIGGLPEGQTLPISLELRDRGGNQGFDSVLVTTRRPEAPNDQVVRIAGIQRGKLRKTPEEDELTVVVSLSHPDGAPAPDGSRLSAFAYLREDHGPWQVLHQIVPDAQMTPAGSVGGRVAVTIPLPDSSAARRTLAFGVREVFRSSGDQSIYVEALDTTNFVEFDL